MQFPSISVVVVNYNGLQHLEACFSSLLRQDYPAECIELLLVDNTSQDGSREFLRTRFPRVKLILNDDNVGFAPAVNQGAAAATGDYLALMNNDAYADPAWLSTMMATMQEHLSEEVVCVGAKLLDWHGRHIDFVGGGINFYGMGDQFLHQVPVEAVDDVAQEVLFACGGAMLVDRHVFLSTGGFDKDYFAYFEDVDFGWRLWIAGYRVRYEPSAIVYHRQHGTSGGMYQHQVNTVLERNALLTIIKNYDDDHLNRVLGPALLLMLQRSLSESRGMIDRQEFDMRTRGGGSTSGEVAVPKMAISYLVAISDLLRDFPQVWLRRQAVQRMRRRSDDDIFPLFRRPTGASYHLRPYLELQSQITDAFDIRQLFAGLPSTRVLILSTDPLYANLAGPGIRTLEMARYLSKQCHVTVAAPGRAELDLPNVTGVAVERGDSETIRHLAIQAEVVILQGFTLHNYPFLKNLNRVLVVDLYDPFHLENLELHTKRGLEHAQVATRFDVEVVNDQLQWGDFFVCASERQRDFWLGSLGSVGRLSPEMYQQDPSFRSLIDVVPFGLPPTPPVHTQSVLKGVIPGIERHDFVLLWGGGIWNWLDPLTIIRAVARLAPERPRIKLFFLGNHHPNPDDVKAMVMYDRAIEVATELEVLNTHVFFNDRWVPYEERQGYLLEADVGVSAHFEHVETRFAFRTRLLDYIWAGLPLIVSAGDTLAEQVTTIGAGRVVAAEDVDGWVAAIGELADLATFRADCAPIFARLQEAFAWPNVLRPLLRFCATPHYASDNRRVVAQNGNGMMPTLTPELQQRMEDLDDAVAKKNTHIAQLEHLLQQVQQGRVMKVLRLVDAMRKRS
ncbi:MAG: hypothetical protein NVSMB42_14220 [Herpetosiphon sp.]